MNEAAMNCRQEQVLHSQHQDSGGLRSPGYHLQINHPSQQNSHPQHSKALNYKSNPFVVDGSADYFQHSDKYNCDGRRRSTSGEARDPRARIGRARTREPIELPVPQFEIDENYVGEPPIVKDTKSLVEISKDLDLDTRIDLLIKSKALAGMHPIFSELDQSDESSSDSDIFFTNMTKSKHRLKKRHKFSPPPAERMSCLESFDDPEKPLSRPPSPFLSRATYLFWFNKAIELKQQAKAQEQALLEKAAKKLIQDNFSVVKTNQTQITNQETKPILGNLLNEISKELKVIMKREFIKEVIEQTAFNTLEDWWEKQKHLREKTFPKGSSVVNSVPSEVKSERPWSSPKVPCPSEKVDSNSEGNPPAVETMLSANESCSSEIEENKIVVEKKPREHAGSFSGSEFLSDERILEKKSCQETSLSKINTTVQTTNNKTSLDCSSLSFPSACSKVEVKTDEDLVPTLNNSPEAFVDIVDRHIKDSSQSFKKETHREPSTSSTVVSAQTNEVTSDNNKEILTLSEFSDYNKKVTFLGQTKTDLFSLLVPNQNEKPEDKDCIQDKENIPSQLQEDVTCCKDKIENNHKEENTSDNGSGSVCSNPLALSP